MKLVIDFAKITNWETFHSAFREKMGFPGFYGKNMNAWIDCMSYIDDPDAGMSTVVVQPGESLEMIVLGTEAAFQSCPEVLQGFIEGTALVNQRFIEANTSTRLKIVPT